MSTYPEAIAHRPEADSFNFGGAIDSIQRAVVARRWVVIGSVLLTVLLAAAYAWIWPPVFEAKVMVSMDSDKDTQRNAFYQGWNIFRKEGLSDEATLMVSPSVLREVVRRLDLKYEDVYHPFGRYAVHLWTTSAVGRSYRSFKKWLFQEHPNPLAPSEEEIERYKVITDFEAGVKVTQIGETNIGLLVVKGSNQRVADIANEIVDAYLRQRKQRYVDEAEQAHASLLEETLKTRAELDVLDARLQKFRTRSGAVLLFEKDRSQIGRWSALRTAITELEAQIANQEAERQIVDRELAAESHRLESSKVYREDAYRDRLPKLELALAAARQSYQPGSREVRDLEDQIKEAQAAVADGNPGGIVRNTARVSDNYETLRAKRLALISSTEGSRSALKIRQDELRQMDRLIDQIPEKVQTDHELLREQSALERKYAGLSDKLAAAAVSMATARSAPPALRVVEPASAPEAADWPKTKLLLLTALLLGLMVGATAAVMLDSVFARVTRRRLLEGEAFGGIKLLAVVHATPASSTALVGELAGAQRASPGLAPI